MFKNQLINRLFSTFIILLLSLTLWGCSTSDEGFFNEPSEDHNTILPAIDKDIFFEGAIGGDVVFLPSDDIEISSDTPSNNQSPIPGQITSSAWSDIDNYDLWLSLFKSDQENPDGLFNEYFTKLNKFTTQLYTQNKVTVNIKNGETPIENLPVKIQALDFKATVKTDVYGNAHFFLPKELHFPYRIHYENETYEFNELPTETISLNTTLTNEQNKLLDIMFVIDTTGSMSDELEYLKSEIKDVIENINTEQQNIRLGLLFYRDNGDQYVTRLFDFTTNINEQIANISAQRANGGGDWPEAVDYALSEAINQANWSESFSTKLLIHVLDAPPHDEKLKMENFANSIMKAAEKGIRIIPVASSGIDKYTEFLLRTESIITGGTYTYITNDSGIGNNHIDATVGETVIEYLNAMLIRLINQYYTGVKTSPVPYNQSSPIEGE